MPKTLRGWPLNADIQNVLDNQAEAWGIKVSNVEIKLVDLDESMIPPSRGRTFSPRKDYQRGGASSRRRRSCSKPRILALGGPFRKLSIRIKTRKFARVKLSTIEDSINAQFL